MKQDESNVKLVAQLYTKINTQDIKPITLQR